MLGNVVRIALLAAWIGLTGWYILRQVLPDLGLVAESDPKVALATRLNKVQRYALLWRPQPTHAAERVGTCSMGVFTDDVGVRLETQIDITRTRWLPGERMLRQAIGGNARSGIRLRMDEMLDANMRLRAIDVAGSVFGVAFSAEGPVDHNGLRLTWKAAGTSGTRIIPEVRPDRVAGGDLTANLPAGLKVGQQFSNRISTLDPTRLRLATKEAVFVVLGRVQHRTAAGNADLLEVEMRLDGRRFALLRCDDRGAVHRQELLDAGMILELTRVDDQYYRQIWPSTPVPDAPPPIPMSEPRRLPTSIPTLRPEPEPTP